MWYVVFPLLVCLASYLYHVLSRTSGSEFNDNSIDAFILEDGDDTVRPHQVPRVDRYKTDYVKEGKQVLILFGTEYGLSEEIAKLLFDRILKLSVDAFDSPFQPRLVNARDYQLIDFSQEHVMFIIISTSGDGVPPSDAREFYDFVLKTDLDLHHLEYSLLALGDTNYPQFCKTGRQLDARLIELGCRNVIKRQDVDMEDWSIINDWVRYTCDYLATVTIETRMDYLKLSDVVDEKYNRHHPFMAILKVKKQLTVCINENDKETIHCEFDITGSELTWLSGDALGIYPRNNPPEVKRLLDAMHCKGTKIVDKPSFAYTCDHSYEAVRRLDLQTVITQYYDMKTVRPELLRAVRDSLSDPEEVARISELLKDENSEYRCTICPNRTFPKCHQVKTHLVEYHSGIGYVCPREGCDKIYRKRQTHQQCPVPPSEMQFFDERSGDVGKVAEEHLNFFKQHVLPTKWVEEHKRPNNYPGGLPPRAISPLPPDPEQLRSPLARVNPGKPAMTYSRKKAEKRQRTSPTQKTPSRDDKRPRTETSDEVDLGHDPMDITLLPGPSTSTSVLERHPDVHFDPQIQIESDENENIIMDIGDIMVTETNSDEQIPEIQSEITSEPKTEKQTNKEQISGTASKEQKMKSKDMERTVKKAKLTVKKYLEKTGAKSNNIVRKGGKTQPKDSKCGKAAKSSKTLKVKENIGGEQTSDARKVNLKVSCETNRGDIREGENLHFTQSEVTIPGTLGRYLGDEDADPLTRETQSDIPLTFHMDEQECRLFIADNTRIRHPGSTQFLSAKTRETDVPINILENIRLSLLHHLQKTQEEAVVLRVGGKDFPTSMVTLRADPTSLLAVMLTAKSPFRPCAKKHFYLDRDPTHFRYILNYLRGGAHIESTTLPNDERSLMELLVEARFYMCERLQEIVLAKLRKVTGSGALY